MKKLILIALLFTIQLTAQEVSQSRVKSTFRYSCTVEQNSFVIVFANYQYPGTTLSLDPFGYYQTECMQDYLEIVVKLLKYGAMPNHIGVRGIEDNGILNLTFILSQSHAFILIRDVNGRVWKLTHTEAIDLANTLKDKRIDDNDINSPHIFEQLRVCGCE